MTTDAFLETEDDLYEEEVIDSDEEIELDDDESYVEIEVSDSEDDFSDDESTEDYTEHDENEEVLQLEAALEKARLEKKMLELKNQLEAEGLGHLAEESPDDAPLLADEEGSERMLSPQAPEEETVREDLAAVSSNQTEERDRTRALEEEIRLLEEELQREAKAQAAEEREAALREAKRRDEERAQRAEAEHARAQQAAHEEEQAREEERKRARLAEEQALAEKVAAEEALLAEEHQNAARARSEAEGRRRLEEAAEFEKARALQEEIRLLEEQLKKEQEEQLKAEKLAAQKEQDERQMREEEQQREAEEKARIEAEERIKLAETRREEEAEEKAAVAEATRAKASQDNAEAEATRRLREEILEIERQLEIAKQQTTVQSVVAAEDSPTPVPPETEVIGSEEEKSSREDEDENALMEEIREIERQLETARKQREEAHALKAKKADHQPKELVSEPIQNPKQSNVDPSAVAISDKPKDERKLESRQSKPKTSKKKTIRLTRSDIANNEKMTFGNTVIYTDTLDTSNLEWKKPDWTKERKLRKTGKAERLVKEGNLANPITNPIGKGDGINKYVRPEAILTNTSGPKTSKSVEWEKPEWAKKTTLRATGKADQLKKEGNLQKPITHPLGKGDGINKYVRPESILSRSSPQEEKSIAWEKPVWAKTSVLKSTQKGSTLKSGGEIARPITRSRPSEET